MAKSKSARQQTDFAAELEAQLTELHGPMMAGHSLYKALGYRSADSFRRALLRNKLPIKVFTVKDRKGRHALTRDVARWIASVSGETNPGTESGFDRIHVIEEEEKVT